LASAKDSENSLGKICELAKGALLRQKATAPVKNPVKFQSYLRDCESKPLAGQPTRNPVVHDAAVL